MIVKNEARHLADCVASVSGLADEICVVDTGSTDGTVELAASLGCRVGHFAWCDDFAAARNASLTLCTGDWIFALDADERIAQEDHPRIRALLNGPRDAAYRVTTRNYTDNAGQSGFVACVPGNLYADGFAGWFPSVKVRLFPNGLGAHFEGPVHELINPSLERAGVRLLECDVPVHHYGLARDASALAEKHALYLRLGQAKVLAEPGNPKAHAELGNQYVEMGAYGQAVAAYREALRLAPKSAELLKDLGGVLHLMGRAPEAERALQLAVEIDPGHVEAWRNLGVVLAGLGHWAEAEACFSRALAHAPGHKELTRYAALMREKLGLAGEMAADAPGKKEEHR